jgi:hypothetical protein
MNGAVQARRNGLAFGLSALIHLALVALLLNQEYRPYNLPSPTTEPIQMEIERVPEAVIIPPPPPVTPPVLKEEPIKPPVTTPPVTTPTPEPQVVVKVKPVAAAVSAKPAPLVAKAIPTPSLTPAPIFTPAPEPIAPPAPKAQTAPAPAISAPAAPRLNLHKPEKEAPAGVLTLPMAPSSAPRSGGAPPGGAEEPGMGSSRLQGLTPFPPGAFPSGGLGLRGSLVGCANSQAVGLSSVERAHCNQRFGVDVAKAPHLDGMSPEKRAAFDRTVEKETAWKAYRDSIPANGTPPGPNGQGRLGPLQPQGLLQNVIPHN